jgi:hypothetical protein
MNSSTQNEVVIHMLKHPTILGRVESKKQTQTQTQKKKKKKKKKPTMNLEPSTSRGQT